jgi:AraC-like DNA-binding protein
VETLVERPVNGWDEPAYLQLTPGDGDMLHASTLLDESRVHFYKHAFGAQLRTAPLEGRFLVGFITAQTASVGFYADLWHEQEIAFVRDAGIDLCTLGAASYSWLEAPAAWFAPELAHIALAERSQTIRSIDGETMRRLKHIGAGDDGIRQCDVFEAIALALRRSTPIRYRVAMASAARSRYRLVRRAEAFMWEHVEEPLSLGRVANALSCKVRTLVYSFHKAFGLGPLSYFKLQRLNAVRQRILRDRCTPILDIACEYGFWHMGHFSQDFRTLFGATPSQIRTLHVRG